MRRDDGRARDVLAVLRQEQRRRIGHAAQSALGHREHAELVRRAEAILDRAHEPEARMRVALEVEDGVDDVLEHPRAGDRAFLGHVADEDDDDVALLREPRELGRAFADLRDAARRRGQRLGVGRLDRIDDDDLGRLGADRGDDRLEVDLGQQRHRRVDEAEPHRAERDLLGRFLPGHVQRLLRGADRRHRLQEQRRLADARIAAEQDHASRHETAAQHAVELLEAGRKPRRLLRIDGAEGADRRRLARRPTGTAWPARPRSFRPACSMRCSAGTGPAISAPGRRTRCSCRRSCSWPRRCAALTRARRVWRPRFRACRRPPRPPGSRSGPPWEDPRRRPEARRGWR